MNTFLQLGDSYTTGEGVEAEARWGNQLANALRKEGVAIVDPYVIATTGWTTNELAARLDAIEPLGREWGLVTLSIGVNNQYRGQSLATYREEFKALLERAIAHAQGDAGRVLVMSIPDWGVTPFAQKEGRDAIATANEIDAFNAAAREIADAHGVRFVDITPVSRRYGAASDMLTADGLHPSSAMYGLWAERALEAVRDMPRVSVHG